MVLLVEGTKAEHISDWVRGGSRALALLSHNGGVIREVVDGLGVNVDGLGKDVELSYGGSEFQLAVGAGDVWVAAGDEAFGDGGGPAATPEHGQDLSIAEWDKVYPSQTEAQCVTSTVSGRGSVQNNFRDLRRARTHIFDKNGKVL
jgi:hypothetical protein